MSISDVVGVILELLVIGVFGVFLREKMKNVATKRDIEEITRRSESVRAEIALGSALIEKRREVYESITDAMGVFIEGHDSSDERKQAFHAAYAACWLWAPDVLLSKLNELLDANMDMTKGSIAEDCGQEIIKALWGQVILEMRKDAGFSSTSLGADAFRFVKF